MSMQSIAPVEYSPRAISPRAHEPRSGRTVEPSPLSQSQLSSPAAKVHRLALSSPSSATSPTLSREGQLGRRQGSAPQSPIDGAMASSPPADAAILPAKAYNSQGNSPVESSKSSPNSTINPPKTRNVSAPHPPMSPPQSPAEGGAPRPVGRADANVAPRNASIDSTGSGASAGSQPQDPTSPTSAEISAMITAAGSAEVVIAQLLREKKQAATQNAQLFRLVQKQRSLIYGLNQDLEKAAHEKEKFRKSIRDGSAHMSPARGAKVDALRKDSPAGSTSTQSEDELPIQRHSVEEPAQPTKPEQAEKKSLHTGGLYPQSSRSKPSSQTHSPIDGPSPVAPIAPLSITKREPPNATAASSPSSFAARRSFGSSKKSPISGPASPVEEAISPSSRKGPPAPLNLGKPSGAEETQSPADYGPEDHSGSEYEEAERDHITGLERGRKKTRAEDDFERELLVKHEQESRSLSKKQKSSKSNSMAGSRSGSKPTSIDQHIDPTQYPLPKSPLPGHMGSNAPNSPAGSLRSDHRSPHASIAGMLSDNHSSTRQTVVERTLVAAPPMSPGLPVSPRPADRPVGAPTPRQPREGYITSPPNQERNGGLSPTPPQASPKSPLKSPRVLQTSNLSITSHVESELPTEKVQQPTSPKSPKVPKSPRPDVAPIPPQSPPPVISPKSPKKHPSVEPVAESKTNIPSELMVEGVYRGLVSEEHPTLLLTPSSLSTISVKVTSSRLKPSRQSTIMLTGAQEEPVFTLGIVEKSNSQQLWRIEKPIMSLPQLDYQLKQVGEVSVKLPERSLFSGHAPAKIDARRTALESYFEALLEMEMWEPMAMIVCRYFSTHVIPCEESGTVHHGGATEQPGTAEGKIVKEGYLTKRGKQFGGWKARFFVLNEPVLRYYDAPGGSLQGTIKLYKAQIGRQSVHNNQSPSRDSQNPDNQFRHAFLIMEPKKKDNNSHVRHVLCAENDKERDEWVYALLQYVNTPPEETKPALSTQRSASNSKKQRDATPVSDAEQVSSFQSVSYEDTMEGEAPRRSVSIPREHTGSPASQFGSSQGSSAPPPQTPTISGPKNGAIIQNAGAWGNKSLEVPSAKTKDKELKKRSIWGFRDRIAEFSGEKTPISAQSAITPRTPSAQQAVGFGNYHKDHVFGVPLKEAVDFCVAPGSGVCLPAVVYRCLTYLDANKAEMEEGIFRLSGSNTLVRNLKEKFNTEGDLDLLAGDTYYDVHAIASLLKLYLRELPTAVLTKQLHVEFLAALDIENKEERLMAYCVLVARLPLPNWTLVRSISEYLLKVINNATVNKMSVRNVGIVFAPTLNIPAPVFASFLTDFDAIFNTEPPENAPHTFINHPGSITTGTDSPRKQLITDSGTGFSVQTPLHTPAHPPGPGLPNAPNDRTSYLPGRVPTPNQTPRGQQHAYSTILHTAQGTPYETQTHEKQQPQAAYAPKQNDGQPRPTTASFIGMQNPHSVTTRPSYETTVSFERAPPGPPPSAPATRQSTLVAPDRPKYASGIGQLEVMRDAKTRRRESAMMTMGNANGNNPGARRKSSLPQMGNVPSMFYKSEAIA